MSMTTRRLAILVGVLGVANARAQVLPPPGFEFIKITDDEYQEDRFRINDCGEVVFTQTRDGTFQGYELFRYENGLLTQLTEDVFEDRFPEINDAGSIVWKKYDEIDENGNALIYIFKDGLTEPVAMGSSPVLNDLDCICWELFTGEGCEKANADIYCFDGGGISQITDSNRSNQIGGLNGGGQIAFTRYDFCPTNWHSDIMLVENGEFTELTVLGEVEPQSPEINDHGLVAWWAVDGSGKHYVEMWKDGLAWILTDWGESPHLNDIDHVLFNRWDDAEGTGWPMLYSEGQFHQLADGSIIVGGSDINNFDEVVLYLNYGIPHTDVGLIRRIRTGDFEFDGDIDLVDFGAFQRCFTGPGDFDRLCDCRFLDLDHDRDVDLEDYAIFQSNFTGPQSSDLHPNGQG